MKTLTLQEKILINQILVNVTIDNLLGFMLQGVLNKLQFEIKDETQLQRSKAEEKPKGERL